MGYDASAVATASASTTLVVTKPANVVVGSLLVVAIGRSVAATPTLTGWATVPSSTQKNSAASAFGSGCGFLFKWADAGDVAAADFTFTSTSSEWVGRMFAVHGLTAPFLDSAGNPVPEAVFDAAQGFARSGTSITDGDATSSADVTYDHYWVIAAPCVTEAAATRTLSAMTGHMSDTTYTALVGVSMATGVDEWTVASSSDDPTYPNTAVTTSNASGTGRGYILHIADPITTAVQASQKRRKSAANHGNTVN